MPRVSPTFDIHPTSNPGIGRGRRGERYASGSGRLAGQAKDRSEARRLHEPSTCGLYRMRTGELASMLLLCAGAETQKASTGVTEEALQIKMVAGTGFEPVTFRL